MIFSKENQSTRLPYGEIITKLITTFNIDTMDKVVDSSNNRIKYAALREMKVHIKHGELRVDPVVEEEDLEKLKNIWIIKVFEICQSIAKEVNKLKRPSKGMMMLMAKNDLSYMF